MNLDKYQDDLSLFFEARLNEILKPAVSAIEAMMIKYTDSVILDLPRAVEIRMAAAIMVFQGLSEIEKLAGFRPGEE